MMAASPRQEALVKSAWIAMTDCMSVRILCLICLQDDQSARRRIWKLFEYYGGTNGQQQHARSETLFEPIMLSHLRFRHTTITKTLFYIERHHAE